MRHSLLKLALIAVALAVVIIACKKNNNDDNNIFNNSNNSVPEYDTQSSQDNWLAENTYNDMGSMADQASAGDSLASYRPGEGNLLLSNPCITVSRTGTNPTIITIDFGSSWCFCWDGRYRKGKFTVSFNGSYSAPGTVITVAANSSDNYCVKYITDTTRWMQVTGTHTVTNQGVNGNGHLQFSVNVTGTLQNNAGQTMTWNSQRTREWLAGDSTQFYWLDDKYSITGNGSGTSFEGVHYNVNIDNPLIVDFTCFTTAPYSCKITQGKISLTPDGKPARSIDFGSGACDNVAVCTVNNVSFNILVR